MKNLIFLLFLVSQTLQAQSIYYLKADRLFDGEVVHEKWGVVVKDRKIEVVGNQTDIERNLPAEARTLDFGNATLLPGLIEGHSHLLLHPYNETSWDDQVLKEPRAMRVARATVHAERTLMAGFTTVRDLGTEGADYDDVGLKQAINLGIIKGPRMIVATRALIATGSYAPKGFSPDVSVAQGAEEADGHDGLIKAVRTQIGKGADLIKIYADYRWGLMGEARPTYTQEEIKLIVDIASSSGRGVVAHASTTEGMRRAIEAGVETIEHGDAGTPEIFRLMASKNVCLCPTLAAGDAISQYRGWIKGSEPEPERLQKKRITFKQALDARVKICMGGDVGVFAHGDNAREMEMMVNYGMSALETLRSATSVNADAFHYTDKIGRLQGGLLADIIVVEGNPSEQISDIRRVKFVMKEGRIYKSEK
ncbi:MAG: amidohydrolase family protein [Saprospiraceae bacterium]|nr:amidohydrolase family protein [Saprospiraceae bacterium]